MEKTNKIRWIARIWSAPIILFTLLMSTGYAWSWISTGKADPHGVENYHWIENIPPLFMFLAVAGLAIAWRREKAGGIINLVFSFATLPILLFQWPVTQDIRFLLPYVLLIIVAFPGILFLTCRYRTQKGI